MHLGWELYPTRFDCAIEIKGIHGVRQLKSNTENIERHFMDAMVQAYNNENNVAGIVVNAFSESIIIRREIFELFWDKECMS